MSPGWKPRPSLSGETSGCPAEVSPGGSPGGRLTPDQRARRRPGPPVSPGWKPRPSLSGPQHQGIQEVTVWPVDSPASLSRRIRNWCLRPGVAGVEAPAFVERAFTRTKNVEVSPGVEAPAFVPALSEFAASAAVSPGWKPRPSLSDAPAQRYRHAPVDRSVEAPSGGQRGWSPRCRRGGSPGLR